MMQLNSLVESNDGNKSIKIRNFQALIDDNYNHNSNHQGILFSKASSILNSNSSSTNDEDDVSKQVQLNLRISTSGDNLTSNHHVTKVMIQNYASLTGDHCLSQ